MYERIKNMLVTENYTCVLTDNSNVYTNNERGLKPLIKFIDCGINFKGGSAADKIVGKAAALLYAYMGISCLYAVIISQAAIDVCKKFNILLEYNIVTTKIINRKGNDICPMEKAVADVDDPLIAKDVLSAKIESMQI